MNIFISWSGETSMKIAEELKNWIPKVLQSAKPYYTPSDIDKGTTWETEINQKLSECLVGLICLTVDNTEKPWILFEAGALSNRLDKSKVCPILFGLKKAEVTGPLARFQLTDFNKTDFFKLIQSINKSLEENAIDGSLLLEVFDAFYPKFEEKINGILSKESSGGSKPKRTERSILEEILDLVRKQNNNSSQINFTDTDANDLKNVVSYFRKSAPSHIILYTLGDKVFHSHYGKGSVIEIFTSGNKQQKLTIKFSDGTTMILPNDNEIMKIV